MVFRAVVTSCHRGLNRLEDTLGGRWIWQKFRVGLHSVVQSGNINHWRWASFFVVFSLLYSRWICRICVEGCCIVEDVVYVEAWNTTNFKIRRNLTFVCGQLWDEETIGNSLAFRIFVSVFVAAGERVLFFEVRSFRAVVRSSPRRRAAIVYPPYPIIRRPAA